MHTYCLSDAKHGTMHVCSLLSPLTGCQSQLKDSIIERQNQKASNRQRSHLKDSSSCLALANQT